LEVSDAIHTASYLLDDRQPVELVCLDAADANDSGTVDISDVIFTLSYHYGGDAPSSAFPRCDSDPTSDALTGCNYPEEICVDAAAATPLSERYQELRKRQKNVRRKLDRAASHKNERKKARKTLKVLRKTEKRARKAEEREQKKARRRNRGRH
ncbi:MAG: hypothetical protein O7J95_20910, partial [Planctomycetota bacterium]|nr:hypothetical protein [Planctomycetota bacterium]